MDKDVERKLLVIEIRTLAGRLAELGGQNPLEFLGVDLEQSDMTTLRQIRAHFRDLHRSLGGSRGTS
jgi:hypothetical protein